MSDEKLISYESTIGWIDRNKTEPETDHVIIAWGEGNIDGRVCCYYDYESWLAVGCGRGIEFRFWMPAPSSPYMTAAEVAKKLNH